MYCVSLLVSRCRASTSETLWHCLTVFGKLIYIHYLFPWNCSFVFVFIYFLPLRRIVLFSLQTHQLQQRENKTKVRQNPTNKYEENTFCCDSQWSEVHNSRRQVKSSFMLQSNWSAGWNVTDFCLACMGAEFFHALCMMLPHNIKSVHVCVNVGGAMTDSIHSYSILTHLGYSKVQ